jgi:hypothetical protein
MTDEKKSIAYRLGSAYGTLKKGQENRRNERIERREKELPIREKEMALKEREARLNARNAKINKSGGGGALGGIIGSLGQAFGPAQSSGYSHSKSARSMGPLIPDPLSNNPYGPPVKAAYKKHKKSKGKGKNSGQNIHIHIDK